LMNHHSQVRAKQATRPPGDLAPPIIDSLA
jgi:hypothetical protein